MVVAQVFRSTATGKYQADVFLRIDVTKGDVGFQMVALPFLGNVQTFGQFVNDEMIDLCFRRRDIDSVVFSKAIKGEHRVENFRAIANDHKQPGAVLILRYIVLQAGTLVGRVAIRRGCSMSFFHQSRFSFFCISRETFLPSSANSISGLS